MKKLYTIAAAVLLGAFGFEAAAQTPTFVTPMGLSELYSLSITWDYEVIEAGSLESSITLPDGTVREYKGFIDDVSKEEQGGTMTLAKQDNAYTIVTGGWDKETGLYKGLYEKGTYILNIPEGCVTIEGQPNKACELIYNIGRVSNMGLASISFPSGGDYISYLDHIVITWDMTPIVPAKLDSYATLSINDEIISEKVPLNLVTLIEDPVGNPGNMTDGYSTKAGEVSTNAISIDFGRFVRWGQYGEYVISIPAGIVADENGALNMAQRFVYHVYPEATPAQISYEGNDEGEVSKVVFTFEDNITINETAPVMTAENQGGEKLVLSPGIEIAIEGNQLTVDMTKVESEYKEWEIILPSAYVIVGGNKICAEQYTGYFTIASSGIESVLTDGADVKVYNLQGERVGKENLTSGLYIINGKKVMIRK